MSQALSLKQIFITLESIAERHYLINSFFIGDDADLNAAKITYPVFQVEPEIARLPQNTYGEYKEMILTLRCKVLDRELQDGSNTQDVHSDTLRITQDVINEINQHPFYQNSNITLDGDINIDQLNEFQDDYTAGWSFDLNLKIINKNNFCGLPMESIPGYSIAGPEDYYNISWGYLTCETVTGCTNLVNFIQSYIGDNLSASTITYLQNGTNTFTGGTPTQPTVNVTGGTFGYVNVTGGTLSSGGTDLYNIFITSNDGNDITRVQPGLNIYTGGSANYPTVNISGATLAYLSAATISATTFYSGATNLNNIINTAVSAATSSLTSVAVQNGVNTFTGGTAALPTVNVTGGTVNNWNVTGGTLASGGTDLYSIFVTALDGNDITRVQPGTNTYTGGTANNPTVNVSAATLNNLTVSGQTLLGVVSASTFSGGTFLSGGTNLYNIFSTTDNNDITRVQPGLNTYTGGTANNPTVNISAATLVSLSATSISATTFYSGSTPLSSIIINAVTGSTAVGSTNINGLNTYTGGSTTAQSINVSAATLDNLSVSGNSILSATSASTVSILNSGATTIIYNDYSGNRIYTGVSFSSIVGGTGNTINYNLSNVNIIGGYKISGTNDNHTYTSNLVVTGTSNGNLYATNYFSGSTPLQTIITNMLDGNDVTRVQPGTNTYTGGTANLPTVNISAATLNNLTVSGQTLLTTVSASTFSGGTYLSGGTDLYNIFLMKEYSGGTSTLIQNGLNTYTGGTSSLPTVNVSAATLSYLSATTISGDTIYSGSNNIANIFVVSGSNVGSAIPVFKQKNGYDLEFRSFSAGTNITITSGDTITINSTGGGSPTGGNYIGVTGSSVVSLTGTPVDWIFACSDETSQIQTGTSKVTFYAPYNFTITDIKASLAMSGSVSATTFDVNLTGTTIFSTRPTIDAGQYTSIASTTQRVITATTVPADSRITIDIDTIGTGCTGAKLYILGTRNL